MADNGKDTKHTRHIFKIMNLVRNYEEWNLCKTVWCQGGLQLSDIVTNNSREYELNHRLWYDMVRLDNQQNTSKRGVTVYNRVWRIMCSERINCIELRTWLN